MTNTLLILILIVLLYQNFYQKIFDLVMSIKKNFYDKRKAKALREFYQYEDILRKRYDIYYVYTLQAEPIAYNLAKYKIEELNKKYNVDISYVL